MNGVSPSRKNHQKWQASAWVKSLLSRLLVFPLIRCLPMGRSRKRKKFAVYKPDGIGDFVLSTEALRVFIDAHGSDNVALILSRELVDLASEIFPGLQLLPIVPGHSGWLDKVRGFPMLRTAVQANTYEEVVCLRHYRTLYDDTILRALQAKRVVLLANQALGRAQVDLTPVPEHFHYIQPGSEDPQVGGKGVPREWSFHAAVLSPFFGRSIAPESLRPEWDAHRMRREACPPFMLISPLAGRKIRDLPLPLVQAAVRQAFTDGLTKLVVTGTRSQSAELFIYADVLRADLPGCTIEVAQPADLPALVGLVASAALVLTAETSTAHLASALDQPAIVLIGGGHFGWFAPWSRSEKQIWTTNYLPCFDCNWKCIFPEPTCLTKIKAIEVQRAVQAVLRDKSYIFPN